jgi:hypothetical protein
MELQSGGNTFIDSNNVTFRKQDTSSGTTVNINGTLNIGGLFPALLGSSNIRITYGLNTNNSFTGTQEYGITYASPPAVFTQMVSNSTVYLFSCQVHSITVSQFSFVTLYADDFGINQSGTENFFWIAIGEIQIN